MENEKIRSRRGIYILLSVLIAVGFWIYVDEFGHNGGASLVEQEIIGIPVEYTNEQTLADRGLMLVENGTSTTVDLLLEGTRRRVTEIDRENVRITANLSSITTPGVQSILLNIDLGDPDDNYSDIVIKKKSISRANVNVTELASKTVEVRCELVGNVAENYSAGQVELSQETIDVRGQAEDVLPVSYAKVTLNIGKNAEETVSQTLICKFYDENDRLLDSEKILPVTDRIQATLPVYVTKEVQLAVAFKETPGANADNLQFTISPSSVIVSGEAGKLRGVNMIVLGEFDLLDLIGNDSASHSYPILIPDGCQNLSGVTRASLEVKFKDMQTATVETSLFQYQNQPQNKTVEILADTLKVKIFGTSEDVAAVTGENITVSVDLSDYSSAAGTYIVPAVIDIMADGDIGVAGTYEVQVKISEELPTEEEVPSVAPEE